MTRTVDEENEQKQKLELQRVPVLFNGKDEVLRPEAVHVKGVDALATSDIKSYVDYYLNYKQEGEDFVPIEDRVKFRVQWIDDNNVNLVFNTHEDALAATKALTEEPLEIDIDIDTDAGASVQNGDGMEGVDGAGSTEIPKPSTLTPEYIAQLLVERQAKSYLNSLALKRYVNAQRHANSEDLFESKKLEKETVEVEKKEEEGSSVVLFIRQAVESDRKVDNAAAYSRYYLLHGEPDRTRKPRRGRRDETRGTSRPQVEDEGDLFLDKLATYEERKARADREEDLFADRMREHSPSRKRR